MYYVASRPNNRGAKYLGMSQIGTKCERSLWYSFRGYNTSSVNGRVAMLFQFGNLIEEEIIRWLKKAGYQVSGQQVSFSDFNGFFKGHADGVVHHLNWKERLILECKSANTKNFEKFRTFGVKKTEEKYYAQIQCYMGYSGIQRGLFLIQNKETSELFAETVPLVNKEFQQLKAKAHRIISSNTPPKNCDTTECHWCSFSDPCLNGNITEFNNRVCGNCEHIFFKETQPTCKKLDRLIKKWGKKCNFWKGNYAGRT